MGYRNETELLHALADLRAHASRWVAEAAALRDEIDTAFIRAGETDRMVGLNRQASHLERCAAIVIGTVGTGDAMSPGAASPADVLTPLLVPALWVLVNNWRGEAECATDPGARQMLREHACQVDELLRWAVQEVRG